jgi:hypothetical protein
MKSEFYDIAFRKNYFTIEQLQKDADDWLNYYNHHRPYSGKYCYGKTWVLTFKDSKHLAILKNNEMVYNFNVSDSQTQADKTQIEEILK